MKAGELQEGWVELGEEVMGAVAEWRKRHPKASFREIEEEIDQQLNGLRAKMLSDTASQSAAAEWDQEGQVGLCSKCGVKLEKKGKKKRKLVAQGGREVELIREYGVCPKCGQGIFPPG